MCIRDSTEAKAPETPEPETKAPVAAPASATATAPAAPVPAPEAAAKAETPGAAPPAGSAERDPEARFAELVREARKSLASERYKAAARAYREVLELKPDHAEARVGLGISLVRGETGDYREASRLLEDVTREQPRNASAWLFLAVAREQTQQKKKAAEAYQRYLSLEPSGKYAADARTALKSLGQ